jgi:hypothetical protein
MASVSFSLQRGQTEFQVTVGTDVAPSGADFEVCINLASFPAINNNEITVMLNQIKNYIAGKGSSIV